MTKGFPYFIFGLMCAVAGLVIQNIRQHGTIEQLRNENTCLIRSVHIGTAAFATIGKNGHAHVVYRAEDCTK